MRIKKIELEDAKENAEGVFGCCSRSSPRCFDDSSFRTQVFYSASASSSFSHSTAHRHPHSNVSVGATSTSRYPAHQHGVCAYRIRLSPKRVPSTASKRLDSHKPSHSIAVAGKTSHTSPKHTHHDANTTHDQLIHGRISRQWPVPRGAQEEPHSSVLRSVPAQEVSRRQRDSLLDDSDGCFPG